MNEVTKVSIAGINISLNQDAYEILKEYLQKIENKYIGNPDGKEIIADIESRIVELILETQEQSHRVSKATIEEIIKRLGSPELEDEELNENPSIQDFNISNIRDKFSKRLYRSAEGGIIGGVCAGISKYFNIDVVWIRFAFMLLIGLCSPLIDICDNSGLVCSIGLYAVLWIIVPMAKSARQKLEMSGEKITASSIGRKISEDATEIDSRRNNTGLATVFTDILKLLGRIVLFAIKVVLIFFATIIGFPIIVVIIVLLTLLIMSIFGIATSLFTTSLFFTNFLLAMEMPDVISSILLSDITPLSLSMFILPLIATLITIIVIFCCRKKYILWSLIIMIILWIGLGTYFIYTSASKFDDYNISKHLNSYYNNGAKSSSSTFKVHFNNNQHYIKNTTDGDTITYERGILNRLRIGNKILSDTTINLRVVTKHTITEESTRVDTLSYYKFDN